MRKLSNEQKSAIVEAVERVEYGEVKVVLNGKAPHIDLIVSDRQRVGLSEAGYRKG